MMHCIIRKKSDAQKALMIELTLLTLLNYVGDNFCEYRNLGHDNYKVTAVAIAAIKCPQHIVK